MNDMNNLKKQILILRIKALLLKAEILFEQCKAELPTSKRKVKELRIS